MQSLMSKIKVTPYAGTRITSVISEAKTLAMMTSMEVEFEFNGAKLVIDKYDDEDVILTKYWAILSEAAS